MSDWGRLTMRLAQPMGGLDLEMPHGQYFNLMRLLPALQSGAVNTHIVVILNAGGGVDWSGWLDRMPALIDAWYPGEQGGRALAEILFGDMNPSGKLPATFEKRWEDNPSSRYYDGVTN